MRWMDSRRILVEFRDKDGPLRRPPTRIHAWGVHAIILAPPDFATLSDDAILDLLRRAGEVGRELEALGFWVVY